VVSATFIDNELYLLKYAPYDQQAEIFVLDYATGALNRRFAPDRNLAALGTHRGVLYGGSSRNLYEVDRSTGATRERGSVGRFSEILGVFGDEVVGRTSEYVYAADLETLSDVRLLHIAWGMASIAGGEGPTDDWFSVPARAGDTLEIATATPGGGPFALPNDLDPVVELYDPGGVLLASDDNGAGDGRNALLTHSAGATGTC
jgi:hypothetical protein